MLLRTFARMTINHWCCAFLLCTSLSIFAQDIASEHKGLHTAKAQHAFGDGEWFKFRIHYGIFNASYATIELTEELWENQPVFHARGIGRTTGIARWFFKVDDHYESYFTKDEVRPLFFVRNINEGGYKKNLNIRFDHPNKKAHVTDILKNKKGAFDTDPNIQDLISFVYFLRNKLDPSTIKRGDYVSVNLFFDEANYLFKFKFLGPETIETKFGNIKALKFRPYVQSGRVFRSSESITLWVSDDKNKIPLRMQADLRVGSITADLDAFKGLKNQFNIVVPD